MERSPSGVADNRLVIQDIIRLLWNTKAHYCIHKSPPLIRLQSYMNTQWLSG